MPSFRKKKTVVFVLVVHINVIPLLPSLRLFGDFSPIKGMIGFYPDLLIMSLVAVQQP